MSGTPEGWKKAHTTIRKKYGKGFYKRIGSAGGSAEHDSPRGFAARPDIASAAGKLGGLARGPRKAPYKKATHCKRGHAYTEVNTYYDKNGHRSCRTCRFEKELARKYTRQLLALEMRVG